MRELARRNAALSHTAQGLGTLTIATGCAFRTIGVWKRSVAGLDSPCFQGDTPRGTGEPLGGSEYRCAHVYRALDLELPNRYCAEAEK